MNRQTIPVFIAALIYLGCATKPVKIEFSATHPANPLAQEARFVAPPNPFIVQDNSPLPRQDSEDSMGHQHMQMEQPSGPHMPKESHHKPMKKPNGKQKHQGHN